MAELTALIVAAGRGIRMGPRGEFVPKGLLEVGGAPLVQRSVQLLQDRGIQTVRIVTGHLNEQYEALFGGAQGVELLHNPAYASTGSLRSLMTGLAEVQGPFVLLESDLIYERAALDPVQGDRSRIVVSGETSAGDEVYIWTRLSESGKPVFDMMSKDIKASTNAHIGELVGISCYTSEDAMMLKRTAQSLLDVDPKSDYESAVVQLAKSSEIDCHLISDLAWTEIDDEGMFARAKEVVWPAICERDSQP